MKTPFVFLSFLVAAIPVVSSLHMCKPFSQAKHKDLTLSFVEAERTESAVKFTFFVEKEGVECTDKYSIASMGKIYDQVQKLQFKGHALKSNKVVDCKVSTPGWEDIRFVALLECPVVDDPERLVFFLEDTAINIDLCSDPTPPSRSEPSLAACVRSFSSTVFGTDTVAVTPEHVNRWLDHHVSLGIERFYLYERNKGELSEYLEPYLKEHPSVRDMVEIAYVPLLSQQNKTFDDMETASYIFDQILIMDACFTRGRTEKFDFVFHIDYDEYIHPQRGLSLRDAVKHDIAYCPINNGLTILRCNIKGVKFDVPNVPKDSVCSHNYANVKTAFNATFMGLDGVFHGVHTINPRCDSESLLIHHLPDTYADRSSSPKYFKTLVDEN